MPADPQSPKAEERFWTITNAGSDGLRARLVQGSGPVPGETIAVVPASLVDELREQLAIAETDASLARSELDSAVASATQILRAERDALRAEVERLRARVEPNPPRTKVCCPDCKRPLGDVIDSLVRQRGKFKSHRIAMQRERDAARAEVARLTARVEELGLVMAAELVNGVSVLTADDGRVFALVNGEAFLSREMVAGMLVEARAEGVGQERRRLRSYESVEDAAFAVCVYDDQVEWDEADEDDRRHYTAMAEAALAAVLADKEGAPDAS